MTQEEKAKRYDELLLKLQKAKVDGNVCDEMYYRVIDDIVHELKESEDERIRESIIENLKGNMCRTDGDYDLLNKQIAWLEKQGEQKQDPCDNCKDVMLNCHNFPCIKKRAFEQGKSVLEVIKEEPQVYDTEDGEIITYSETDGYKFYQPKFKDGDVLNSPSHHLIWIYKDNEHYYACVNMNYVTENVATDGLISIPNDACPATKEQREQLEKAMADAGYTFDFDKKKLKKIEQNPAWSEEDEYRTEKLLGWLNTLINYIQGDATVSLDLYRERKRQVERLKTWLKSLKAISTWKPSDKQIKALEHFVRSIGESGYASPYENNTNLLYSLLEDLKKLK